jgi:ABC-2 type transport system ATP-binding protein
MLEVRSLTKRYNGIPAVEDVSFRIAPGEILGYVGPNGAGKSTTVKMIIGLLEPSQGQILFQGASVLGDLTAFQRRIGRDLAERHIQIDAAQHAHLVFTVAEVLGYAAARPTPRRQRRARGRHRRR